MTLVWIWTLLVVTNLSKLLILAAMLKLHHTLRSTLTFLGRAGLLGIAFAALASMFETLSLAYVARPATALLFAAIAALSVVRAFFPQAFSYTFATRNDVREASAFGSKSGIHLHGVIRRT